MAQIGLRHFKYSPIGANGKYTGVNEMVGAIKATPSLNVADIQLLLYSVPQYSHMFPWRTAQQLTQLLGM